MQHLHPARTSKNLANAAISKVSGWSFKMGVNDKYFKKYLKNILKCPGKFGILSPTVIYKNFHSKKKAFP